MSRRGTGGRGVVGAWRGGRPVLAQEYAALRGVLGTSIIQCRPRDPESKGLAGRAYAQITAS